MVLDGMCFVNETNVERASSTKIEFIRWAGKRTDVGTYV